jgi:hypothetical protein
MQSMPYATQVVSLIHVRGKIHLILLSVTRACVVLLFKMLTINKTYLILALNLRYYLLLQYCLFGIFNFNSLQSFVQEEESGVQQDKHIADTCHK